MIFQTQQKCRAGGFTILEIIIVVIIIGVLASLALPRMSILIERARGTEAILLLTQVRSGMERCYVMTNDYTKCISTDSDKFFDKIGLVNPDTNPNSHFKYSFVADVDKYAIFATRNTRELSIPFDGANAFCFDVAGSSPPAESQIALCSTPSDVWVTGAGIYFGIGGEP